MADDNEPDDDLLDPPADDDGEDFGEQGDDDGEDDDDDAPTVRFEDDSEEGDDDTTLVKRLRAVIKDKDDQLRARPASTPAAPVQVGDEPDMEDADVDYDADKFKEKWTAWNQRKVAAASQQSAQTERQSKVQEAWQSDLTRLSEAEAKLRVPDMEDAKETVRAVLSPEQQAVLVQAADNPAAMIYALAKSPGKLAELSKQDNFIKLGAMVARMEQGVKVVPKKKAAEPERVRTGNARPGGSTDKQLAKLETEADRTGDRTKLVAYKRKLKDKA